MTKKNTGIQALRGLSVIMVILYHFGLKYPSGFIGVDVFFVISGYVVTQSSLTLFTENTKRTRSIFYKKRVNRLLPVFLFFVIFCLLINLILVSPNQGIQQWNTKLAISSLFGISNLVLPFITGDYFSVYSKDTLFLHTWSLSVEIQFYLLMPILLHALINRSRKYVYLGLFSTILISLFSVYLFEMLNLSSPFFNAYFNTTSRVWELTAGVLLAFVKYENRLNYLLSQNQIPISAFWIFFIILFFIGFLPTELFLQQRLLYIIPIFLTCLLVYFSELIPESNIHSSKMSVFFAYLGNRSYSIYLFHYPINVIIKSRFSEFDYLRKTLLSLILVLAISEISYRFVEIKKIDFFKGKAFFRLKLIFIFTFLFLFINVSIVGNGVSWSSTLPAVSAIQRNCDDGIALYTAEKRQKCTWKFGDNFSFLIVGDSLAWSTAQFLIDFAASRKSSLTIISKNGCHATQPSNEVDDSCNQWRSEVKKFILDSRFNHIFIANNFTERFDAKSFATFLSDINSAKQWVTLIIPGPFGDNQSAKWALIDGLRRGQRFTPRPEVISIDDLRSQLSNQGNFDFGLLDLRDVFCNQTRCVVSSEGTEYFLYGNHLSNAGNQQVFNYYIKSNNNFLQFLKYK